MLKQGPDERETIRMLAALDRFSALREDELRMVTDAATYLTVPEHWALIVEQTPADKAYLILKGEVSVRRQGQEVARVGAGDLIGEMALVNHRLRSATVVAMTPLEVLHFTSETVAELAAKIPSFADALAGASQERLGEAE